MGAAFRVSAALAEEGVDGAEEGLLVAFGETADGLEAAGEAAAGRRSVGAALLEAQELVGRDFEDAGESGDGLALSRSASRSHSEMRGWVTPSRSASSR